MNIQNLKYFTDAARLRSITKSADLNNISRPAVSQAIQKLEQELGVKLLVHKRRSFELTQAGLTLLKKSDALFSKIEETAAAVKANVPVAGEFRIGSARTLATFSLYKAISKLKADFPEINIKVNLQKSEHLIEMLENRELDVALFIGDEVLNGFKQIVVGRGHFCLVRPRHTKTEDISFAISEKRPETERLKILFERHFSKELPVFAEIPSWDSIWEWICQGECGGLIPDFLLRNVETSQLAIVFEKVFPYEMKVIFSKTKSNHTLISTFVNSLKGQIT